MIKNERQYKITKAQADRFERSLADVAATPNTDNGLHPLLLKAQKDALRSQFAELREQLDEYDALRSGTHTVLHLKSFDELPRALIKARIAIGLSQKELAERLALKEQQVQRYEETEYASASIERVQQVIKALGVSVREEMFLPTVRASSTVLFKRLSDIGFTREFVLTRLLPQTVAARLQEKSTDHNQDNAVLQAATIIGRVLRFTTEQLLGTTPLELDASAASSARFKVPGGANQRRVRAYTVYAHHIALLALQATAHLPQKSIPIDPVEVRREIATTYGSVNFKNALSYIWSLGIPVLPLGDRGTFYGACFREDGRNVIVLKQQSVSDARWLHLLLHEYRHTGEEPEQLTRETIEAPETSPERRESPEEGICGDFAGEVTLNNRAEELVDECVKESRNKVQLLTTVVPRVAKKRGVSVGALANYMAYRLWQDKVANWWGAATNLQEPSTESWLLAQDAFLRFANFGNLSEIDRSLLQQAVSAVED